MTGSEWWLKVAQQEQYSVCWIKMHRNSSSRLKNK